MGTGSRRAAIGEHGALLTSPDTVTWSDLRTGVRDWLFAVRTWPQGLAAGDRAGVGLTSRDGRIWRRHETGPASTLHGVAWCGGVLAAVGREGAVTDSGDSAR